MNGYGESDRERMSNITMQLDYATNDLEMTNAILEDTLSTEMDSLQELRRQREVLENANSSLDRTNNELDKGDKTLKDMLYRAICNKIFLIIMALVLVVIIGVVVFVGFFAFKD